MDVPGALLVAGAAQEITMITAPVLDRAPPNEALIAALKERFPEQVSTAQAVREQHGKDESYHQPFAPDAVVFARSTEEVAAIVKLCAASKTPIIPFGTGT